MRTLLLGFLLLSGFRAAHGAMIFVPNASFESPATDLAGPGRRLIAAESPPAVLVQRSGVSVGPIGWRIPEHDQWRAAPHRQHGRLAGGLPSRAGERRAVSGLQHPLWNEHDATARIQCSVRSQNKIHCAIYLGPFASITDDSGNTFGRGITVRLNIHDWQALSKSSGAAQFLLLPPT